MSLERVIDRLFDYAGMFPPAALEFHAALKESATFRSTLTRAHMVAADLVLRPNELHLLTDDTLRSAGHTPDHEVKVCLVGVSLDEAIGTTDRIRAFHSAARDAEVPRRVVALEITDERTLDADQATSLTVLRHIAQATTGLGIALYYEPRWPDGQWQDGLDRAIAFLREACGQGTVTVGLKVRCAGPTALTPRTLSAVVAEVADHRFPFKATQGLHHPVVEPDRHDASIGFLGLAAAHLLRCGLGPRFGVDEIEACLTERDPSAFRFEDGLHWRDHALVGEAFDQALAVPFNIGSCSIREPDEDLLRLYGPPV